MFAYCDNRLQQISSEGNPRLQTAKVCFPENTRSECKEAERSGLNQRTWARKLSVCNDETRLSDTRRRPHVDMLTVKFFKKTKAHKSSSIQKQSLCRNPSSPPAAWQTLSCSAPACYWSPPCSEDKARLVFQGGQRGRGGGQASDAAQWNARLRLVAAEAASRQNKTPFQAAPQEFGSRVRKSCWREPDVEIRPPNASHTHTHTRFVNRTTKRENILSPTRRLFSWLFSWQLCPKCRKCIYSFILKIDFEITGLFCCKSSSSSKSTIYHSIINLHTSSFTFYCIQFLVSSCLEGKWNIFFCVFITTESNLL